MPNDDDGDTLIPTDENGEIIESTAKTVTQPPAPVHPLGPTLAEIAVIRTTNAFAANAARITELFALACVETEKRGFQCEQRPAKLGEAVVAIEAMLTRCIEHDSTPATIAA